MSPAVKNGVLLAVVLVVLGLAGFLAFRGDPESEYPDEETGSTTVWIDVDTGEVFKLSAAKLAEWRSDAKKRRRDQNYDMRQLVFYNDATQDYTIVAAKKDPRTSKWYAPQLPDGTEVLPPSMREEE